VLTARIIYGIGQSPDAAAVPGQRLAQVTERASASASALPPALPPSSIWNAITLGILPLASIAFLAWVVVKFMAGSTRAENWSLGGVVGLGLLLMFIARFGLRSPFFTVARESDPGA
jgi:hypothetical protein